MRSIGRLPVAVVALLWLAGPAATLLLLAWGETTRPGMVGGFALALGSTALLMAPVAVTAVWVVQRRRVQQRRVRRAAGPCAADVPPPG